MAGATAVTGGLPGKDVFGNDVLNKTPQYNGDKIFYFGDTGVEQALTDNFKIKLGYDFGDWSSLLNIAYEDRNTLRDSPNSYLTNASGAAVWSGNFVQEGGGIKIAAARLGASELDRRSLSTGLRIKGDLTD